MWSQPLAMNYDDLWQRAKKILEDCNAQSSDASESAMTICLEEAVSALKRGMQILTGEENPL